METIGFIGLGNMGGGMSLNIQKAGYPMVVNDLREEAALPLLEGGARLANTPAEVAESSDIIFTSLPGPREVEAVALGDAGVLEGVRPGGIYVDLSSSRPTLIREIEPIFRRKGAHVLDAPVSGGKTGAYSGNLAVMVGGNREIYERIKPLLDAFGDKVFYAGRNRRWLGLQAGAQHGGAQRTPGHSRGFDPGSKGRGGAGGPVGGNASRLPGPNAHPARGVGAHHVPRGV